MTKKLFTLFLSSMVVSAVISQELVSYEYLRSFSKEELTERYPLGVRYNVDLYKVLYTTPDLEGVTDTASGLVIVPQSEESINWPLLSYSHGTIFDRDEVPSNLDGGYELAMVIAATGYVTAAADFLGLGESRGIHPYLHAASEASATIDMLFATRSFALQQDILLNDQLFITGYSQGGHVAMATHQVLQESFEGEFTVTAAAPMSGPYSVSQQFLNILESDETYLFPGYIAYATVAYNLAYDWGYSMEEIFKFPYSESVQLAVEDKITFSRMNTLLQIQLEDSVGVIKPKAMFQDSIINAILNQPDHPFNLALKDNDTYNWKPNAPTRLFYCTADEQVDYRNSIIADSVMNINGAFDVTATDVDPQADHLGCVFPAALNTIFFFASYQNILVSTSPFTENQEMITAFPNPTAGKLSVMVPEFRGALVLFDVQGKIRVQYSLGKLTGQVDLNVEELPAGIYFLGVLSNSGTIVAHQKIVKN